MIHLMKTKSLEKPRTIFDGFQRTLYSMFISPGDPMLQDSKVQKRILHILGHFTPLNEMNSFSHSLFFHSLVVQSFSTLTLQTAQGIFQ